MVVGVSVEARVIVNTKMRGPLMSMWKNHRHLTVHILIEDCAQSAGQRRVSELSGRVFFLAYRYRDVCGTIESKI